MASRSGHEGALDMSFCLLVIPWTWIVLLCATFVIVTLGPLYFPLHCINSLLSGLCYFICPCVTGTITLPFPKLRSLPFSHAFLQQLSEGQKQFSKRSFRGGGNNCYQGSCSSDHKCGHCSDTAMGVLGLERASTAIPCMIAAVPLSVMIKRCRNTHFSALFTSYYHKRSWLTALHNPLLSVFPKSKFKQIVANQTCYTARF